MRILHSDLRNGELVVSPDHADDLWELSTLIDPDDLVKGKTVRKIKLGGDSERAGVAKRAVTLTIQVEKAECTSSSELRISGWVVDGPEDIPRGAHHTITVEPHDKLTLQKPVWTAIHQRKLEQATQGEQARVLLCVMDRDEAHVARLKKRGYEVVFSLHGDVAKKREESRGEKGRGEKGEGTFYHDLLRSLQELDSQSPVDMIIVASPAFWKEDFKKSVKDDKIAKKMTLATVSSSDRTAFNELLKRQEVQTVLHQDRTSKEMALVDSVMAELGKRGEAGGNAVYGFLDVQHASEAGALRMVVVSDAFIKTAREQKKDKALDEVLRQAEAGRAEIHIISSDHDGGRRLDGIGGIAGVTRYKLENG
ncbi:mRNA surveillance protein pelota [Candidatus Woesearchaeota archaeon]|nr:mRNA surveillance protein pelota [Candidatus Woesearchaeota archaeon]